MSLDTLSRDSCGGSNLLNRIARMGDKAGEDDALECVDTLNGADDIVVAADSEVTGEVFLFGLLEYVFFLLFASAHEIL